MPDVEQINAYISKLGDDGVELQMRFYHDDENCITAREQVAEMIVRTLDAAGIKMATPELIVYQAKLPEA